MQERQHVFAPYIRLVLFFFHGRYTCGVIIQNQVGGTRQHPRSSECVRCGRWIGRSGARRDRFTVREVYARVRRGAQTLWRSCRVRRSGANELHVETRADHLDCFLRALYHRFYLQMHEVSRESSCRVFLYAQNTLGRRNFPRAGIRCRLYFLLKNVRIHSIEFTTWKARYNNTSDRYIALIASQWVRSDVTDTRRLCEDLVRWLRTSAIIYDSITPPRDDINVIKWRHGILSRLPCCD